jgi:hypothetical protein
MSNPMMEKAAKLAKRTAAAVVKPIAIEAPKVAVPKMIETDWARIPVFGSELISARELQIIAACMRMDDINEDDHKVRMIMFRADGMPKGNMAVADYNSQAIIHNMSRTFEYAVEETKKWPEYSITATWHRALIVNQLHEMHHLIAGIPEEITEGKMVKMEEEAEESAMDLLFRLAQTYNIEPSHHSESPFFSKALMQVLKDDKSDWAKKQITMLERNLLWWKPEGETEEEPEIILPNFKTICQLMADADPDAEEWNKELAQPKPVGEPATSTEPDNRLFMSGQGGFDDVIEPSHDAGLFGGGGLPEHNGGFAQVDNRIGGQVLGTVQGYQPATGQTQQGGMVGDHQPATGPVFQQGNCTPAAISPTGLTPEQTRDLAYSVIGKCYNHIFTQCGQMAEGFKNPEAVAEKPVMLTDYEQKIITKFDCVDVNGRWCPENTDVKGGLRGFIMKNAKLPAFKLYINECGVERCRLLLPQNPLKDSKPGREARAGARIMYVMEGDDSQKVGSGFYWKIVNGQIISC